MNGTYLDFERPIQKIVQRIDELRRVATSEDLELNDEIEKLEKKLVRLREDIYRKITPYQRVQLARHPNRPYSLDYINTVFEDFLELHGDRQFRDDPSIVAGWARFEGKAVMVIGQQKGRDTKEKIYRNFGMAHPEGYRKALRLMKMAEKFSRPIITLIDTPGAYPGIGAEERGQAEAIARNLFKMCMLKVPIIVFIIGEGGSGGALGIGIGDRLYVLEYAYYSVISPEGCAAILWKERSKAPEAATSLKLTAKDLCDLEVVDDIIKEPLGGAHRAPLQMAQEIKSVIKKDLEELSGIDKKKLTEKRYEKFRKMGVFGEPETK